MIEKALFIHGIGGHPGENWFPWLKEQLEREGTEVIIPQFPTPENQTLDDWIRVLDQYTQDLRENTIIVAHSLGVAFALTILEQFQAEAAFLIAGYVGLMGNEYDEQVSTFTMKDFDWDRIRANCPSFTVFHSNDDPYRIKLEMGYKIAELLGVELSYVPNAGHFNEAAGYTEFDLLRTKILDLLRPSLSE